MNKSYIKLPNFDIDTTLNCGQIFRWEKTDESYIICANDRVIEIKYNDTTQILEILNSNEEDIKNIWLEFFDAKRDYEKINKELSKKDNYLKESIAFAQGMRILNQDPWETIVSFIISQNNNIKRIKKNIEDLSENFSSAKVEYNDKDYYSIPMPKDLKDLSVRHLNSIKLGYRSKYLIETAQMFYKQYPNGLKREDIENLTDEEAEKLLTQFSGIGPKVANCIMLFAFKRIDSFPIDTWVKKIMNQYYDIPINNLNQMNQFANEKFSPYRGLAQQYLFHYIRNNS